MGGGNIGSVGSPSSTNRLSSSEGIRTGAKQRSSTSWTKAEKVAVAVAVLFTGGLALIPLAIGRLTSGRAEQSHQTKPQLSDNRQAQASVKTQRPGSFGPKPKVTEMDFEENYSLDDIPSARSTLERHLVSVSSQEKNKIDNNDPTGNTHKNAYKDFGRSHFDAVDADGGNHVISRPGNDDQARPRAAKDLNGFFERAYGGDMEKASVAMRQITPLLHQGLGADIVTKPGFDVQAKFLPNMGFKGAKAQYRIKDNGDGSFNVSASYVGKPDLSAVDGDQGVEFYAPDLDRSQVKMNVTYRVRPGRVLAEVPEVQVLEASYDQDVHPWAPENASDSGAMKMGDYSVFSRYSAPYKKGLG